MSFEISSDNWYYFVAFIVVSFALERVLRFFFPNKYGTPLLFMGKKEAGSIYFFYKKDMGISDFINGAILTGFFFIFQLNGEIFGFQFFWGLYLYYIFIILEFVRNLLFV